MKFLHLEIGALFEFKGERYKKAGPFSAINTATGKDQMIMRSASIKPLENGKPPAPKSTKVEWDTEEARDAIDAYHQSCLELVNSAPANTTHEALENAYQQLLKRLSL